MDGRDRSWRGERGGDGRGRGGGRSCPYGCGAWSLAPWRAFPTILHAVLLLAVGCGSSPFLAPLHCQHWWRQRHRGLSSRLPDEAVDRVLIDAGADSVLWAWGYGCNTACVPEHARHMPAGGFCPSCAVDTAGLPRPSACPHGHYALCRHGCIWAMPTQLVAGAHRMPSLLAIGCGRCRRTRGKGSDGRAEARWRGRRGPLQAGPGCQPGSGGGCLPPSSWGMARRGQSGRAACGGSPPPGLFSEAAVPHGSLVSPSGRRSLGRGWWRACLRPERVRRGTARQARVAHIASEPPGASQSRPKPWRRGLPGPPPRRPRTKGCHKRWSAGARPALQRKGLWRRRRVRTPAPPGQRL